MNNEKIYQLALTCIPNIGPVQIKKLLEYFEQPQYIFESNIKELVSLDNIGEARAKDIVAFKDFERAERELAFMDKYDIEQIFYTDNQYPNRLKNCPDSPIILFTKGNMKLNAAKVVSIVGTRNNSTYGKNIVVELLDYLKDQKDLLVVSGLAFGIDAVAHQACVDNQIPTIGVLGHGLKTLYPYQHKFLAEKMMENGGLVSELFHDAAPDRYNFPKRNRIVAGMADVTVVVETAQKGGSMITANLANDYNRDVFAVPGRLTDEKSEGCNWLIAEQKAELYCSPQQFVQFMSWEETKKKKAFKQRLLFQDFDENEVLLVNLLEGKDSVSIDELNALAEMPQSRLASVLLNLELKGIVESLPGKRYALV